MNQLMLESCVHPWDPNNVYKDKCKRFVSSDLQCVKNVVNHWARKFYIYLCKYCWDPKDVRSFLTLIGS